MNKKRFIIIDSNSIIHRAYHALPPLTTKKGELVNAVYGFLLVFFKIIKELQPKYIAACFDFPAPTFRHQRFKEYKAKRKPAPEELYQQIPIVKEVLKMFSVPVFEKEGFEADDIIGTIAYLIPKKQAFPRIEIIILSGDLDNLQLINSQVKVFAIKKGVKDILLYDEKLVKEKFQGLKPEQLLDYKALRGDPSDNIPGVTGVGEKTAIKLIKKFNNLENLYKEIENDSRKSKEVQIKLKELLLKYKEQAFISKNLAKIEKNTPIDFNFKKCQFGGFDKKKVINFLKKLEFQTLINRLLAFEKENLKINKLSVNKTKFSFSNPKKKPLMGENLKLW
jgi:DNA polymerase-1